uniref:WGS project CAEQ00000000 data, annotated contig 140 n=1 Tax=Trypanosoma congolense (strain IL3000) TaxID=1068625 RepID=F9W605_TRYCI|nr:unnamed protein product [Trypanosoma congolense IL3000]
MPMSSSEATSGKPVLLPPGSYVLLWTLPLVLSLFIFGIARPAVRVHPVVAVSGAASKHSQQWWLVQMHLGVAACLLFYYMYVACAYLLLSLKALRRLGMVPLHNGTYGWCVNELRRILRCGSNFYGWFDEVCDDYYLPIIPFPSFLEGNQTQKIYSSTEKPLSRSHLLYYRLVVLLALLLTCATLFYLSHTAERFCIPQMVMAYWRPRPAVGEEGECGGESKDEEEGKEVAADYLEFLTNDAEWWSMGDPDDSWIDSPEARMEERRWEDMDRNESRKHFKGQESRSPRSVLTECLLPLLFVCYAGLYALCGGMALFMLWVYPFFVVLLIIVSLMM